MIFPFKGKKVLIFGLGVLGGGIGVAKFFAENGAKVKVTDLATAKELKPALEKLKKFDISYVLGKHNESDFQNCDLIVKSPAISADSKFLKIAQKAKIPVEMEASLFFLFSATRNIIGVTGTKGKTTTASLIYQFLKKAKLQTLIGGIPGYSILEQVKKATSKSWVVLELSSWQLASLAPHKISPHIGVLTNIFPDHLNSYQTMDEYLTDKKIIFQFQKPADFFITRGDLPITKNLAKLAKSKVIFFSKNTLGKKISQRIKLAGNHNLYNVAAANLVTKILGIPDKIIISVLKKFEELPNHLEVVRKIGGITFINDTAATIPEAAIAAIDSVDKPIILVAGGADKNLNFAKLGKIINNKVKAVVLLEGTATDKIEREVHVNKVIGRFSDFKLALMRVLKFAKKGDVILLSPACASFGMFKNEFDRGEQFKKIVQEMADD